MSLAAFFLELLYPKNCVGCKKGGSYLCRACEARISFTPLPLAPTKHLDGLFALGKHEGVLRNLVKHIKYYGHFDMANTAASLLAAKLPNKFKQVECITAVPLHAKRERERGYNQSELLAKALGKQFDLPYRPLLKKMRATLPQAGLRRQERIENLAGVFSALQPKLNLRAVLLVDDVSTTGTTLNECAKILKSAGVHQVYGVVLAHGK